MIAKGREEKKLMVVCVYYGRVKLANDVTYKRYVYFLGRERKWLMWAMKDELDDGEIEEDGSE